MKLRTFGLLDLAKVASLAFVFCVAGAVMSRAQTFTTLVNFDGTDGSNPTTYAGPLVQGLDGNLYGSTIGGGPNQESGLIFNITPEGTLTTVYNFCARANCTDGQSPGPPILASDGNFYGTTYGGGANTNDVICGGTCGIVYKVSPQGVQTTLYSFCAQANCADGANPAAVLTQGMDGNFYSTTQTGGTGAFCGNEGGCGTFFKITPKGVLTTLYNFCSLPDCSDGFGYVVQTIQATDGNFYGEVLPTPGGQIFKITPSGRFSVLYRFCAQTNCTDGSFPNPVLVQATDGNIYGTASGGGPNGGGTVFRLTLKGRLTTLYSFCSQTNCADGKGPGNFILGADGNFYGDSGGGGTLGYGTVFKITSSGALTTLYSCDQTNCPGWELAQATDGTFYGGFQFGGTGCSSDPSCGTLFSLDLGLPPFVQTVTRAGKVGAEVSILGTNLTGATAVSFDGAAARFTVVSSSEIKAIVPAGAKTGTVTVRTPSSGTLNSNLIFKVIPQIKSFKPSSGPAGTQVVITGVSLTQTTDVTFGGVEATTFTVNSDMQVTATVPTGAKTGRITITTPGGSATSAASFTVT
jgi:uncharacterized repeat protein (TIGR03803 family)